jgi:D-sedoheptulose 7-phosphate isomerase
MSTVPSKQKTSDLDRIRSHPRAHLLEGARVLAETADVLVAELSRFAVVVTDALLAGRKILLCGNGGSAADAQHIAAEFVGRYKSERRAWPAVALTTDSSILTAVANDYGFDSVFARQVEALGREGDVLIAISTSGSSPNVLNAVLVARVRRIYAVALTGEATSPLSVAADLCLRVPSCETPHVQQAHLTILHSICAHADRELEARDSRRP